ncbi:MAG: spoIIIJ-associated protein [Fusobacteriaceae bacterium]|jgi:spoIIIJ-associated protein|nr:single-stranded nucleic acid binding domain protein [Fusobacteriales bacterium]MDN5303846.1 spoIIIJ-associated protein [Fusobacteriaceae bacterium]
MIRVKINKSNLITLEVKAKNEEEAIDKFVLDTNIIKRDYEIEIEVIKKGISILGIISTNNLYKVTATKINKIEEIVVEKTKELLNKMNLDLEIEVIKSKEHFISINLYGHDNGIIIGKKGKTLNSFEFLLNTLIKGCKVEVDVEGFKEKRAETLRELARKMAEKALKTNKTIKLNSMPPRERKIIHEVINTYEELDTYSEGKDPKRYIVIKKKKVG